jgi:hypothetical protein
MHAQPKHYAAGGDYAAAIIREAERQERVIRRRFLLGEKAREFVQ